MFYDDSRGGTSSVMGPDSTPFRPGHSRKVVVQPNLNSIIGMGGEKRDLITFRIEWLYQPPKTMELVEKRDLKSLLQNPRFARTDSDNAKTVVPTMPQTRIHSTLPKRPMIRWARIKLIGSGAFGQVLRAVDVDTGRLIAVKIVKIRQNQHKEAFFALLKREVEAIGRIEHPFVVDYICSNHSINATEAQVVMGLMKGSLHSLLDAKEVPWHYINETANTMLTHMLQALDCVASMGIVHRDVKPENILYTYSPHNELIFKLGDFGLCNQAALAQSTAGTFLYMAPEILSAAQGQTPKADIWSLFMVLIWMYDFQGFRNANPYKFNVQTLQELVRDATAPEEYLEPLKEMGRPDPEKRASAAQMMLKLGLFSRKPKAILCSHGKDPKRIPPMPVDVPTPGARTPKQSIEKKPAVKKSASTGHPAHTNNNLERQHLANAVPYLVHLRYMNVGPVIWRRRGLPIQLYGSQSGKVKKETPQITFPMALRVMSNLLAYVY
ncbi:Protein kinase [Diaporthe amygdali]|uniref:Protein kinase n=1 Tax=Phomopsis amygdali TaxID=1214568 RepID=UPI0022FED36F|nr:Protein kinase [Diaporthe amygdali]KAJ0122161.1 Protein kinase [Diaporthe amygdali]